MTATLDRFMIAITDGNASAKIRLMRNAVEVRPAFASPNRSASASVRTNARMTRTPVICSRSTWLIRSIRACIDRNCGTTPTRTAPISTSITGTDTASSGESAALSCRAMITPPTLMIGAITIRVSPACTSTCTCWMSFVLRVISDGVPKRCISRAENACTPLNTAARMSAPEPIATREAKYTATTETTPRTSVIPSIRPPVVQMYPRFPLTTPLLMMSAFRFGR